MTLSLVFDNQHMILLLSDLKKTSI